MDRNEMRTFLTKVGTDDNYRDALVRDPVGTLATEGITIDPLQVPNNGIRLPSKADILANLDNWTDEFWTYGCASHICWLLWSR
jgi:hypothetical protein